MLRVLLALLPLVAWAEDDLLATVRARAEAVRSLRVPFVQEQHLALFPEPVTTPGVLEIDRQRGAVRWEFTGQAVLVLTDGRVERWDASGRREGLGGRNHPGTAALGHQMQALLDGDWAALEDLFTVTPSSSASLRLAPRDADLGRFVAHIDLAFDADHTAPQRLELHNPGGELTVYRFAPPEVDVTLAAERFLGP